jgi:tRNA1(Val) A37 N6-methylase TrmN6
MISLTTKLGDNMLRQDYIPKHEQLKIYQDTDMFLINSDTEALGEFIEVYKNDSVLDVGTNTGALLLYASLFNPKKLTGLDINEKALEIAKKNLEFNKIENFELIHDNIVTFTHDPYDVIICNPPYFETKEDNKSNNSYKNLAKHESILELKSLVKGLSRNLKDNGTLYFLFLTSRLEEVMCELHKNNLIVKKMKFVYDVNKEYSNVFMVKCVKNAKTGMFVEKPLVFDRRKK